MLRIVLSLGVLLLVIVTASRMMKSQIDPNAFNAQGPTAASQALVRAVPQQVADKLREAVVSGTAARASEADK